MRHDCVKYTLMNGCIAPHDCVNCVPIIERDSNLGYCAPAVEDHGARAAPLKDVFWSVLDLRV